MKNLLSFIAVSLLACGAPASFAAAKNYVPDSVGVASSGVQFVNGGIGQDALQKVRKLARTHDFNVELVFAWRAGNFLADIPVAIEDAQGKTVFTMDAAGPVLSLRLLRGHYTATATYDGATVKHAFEAPQSGMKVVRFAWQKPEDSQAITARN